MHPRIPQKTLQALSALVLLLLTACGSGKATPTVSVDAIYTAAYSTMLAQQATQLAMTPPTSAPTQTLVPTLAPLPTTAALPTLALSSPTAGSFNTGSGACDSSAFVSDLTIPDNTVIDAGKTFTKTWSLLNNGTCSWSTAYTLQFDSGDQMGGANTAVPAAVGPGSTVSISVKMSAPTAKGTYKGVWRMHNASGQAFGDTPWVIIKVGEAAAATAGPSPTAGPTPTGCAAPATMAVSADVQDFTLSFSPSGPTYKGHGYSVDVSVPCGWTGTVTPTLQGTNFKPASRDISSFPPPTEIHFGVK